MAGSASGLTTRGRCLLAAGVATALCSALLDERDLLRVGVLVAAMPLIAVLLGRRARLAVGAERTIEPGRLQVGSTAEVRLAVRRRSPWMFGGLLLEDGVADAAGAPEGVAPQFTVNRLPRRDAVELVYPVRPTLRGRHRVGPLTGRVTDPFGLAEYDRELAPAGQLVALPRVFPLHEVPAGGGETGMAGLAVNRHGHGEVDIAVRPYQHGDELRRVHWRSTARRDELMVRLEERPQRGGVNVLLDRRSAAHRGDGAGSSLEWAVSMAASVGVHLIERGEPVTLFTEDGAKVGDIGGADGLLEALATLRSSARPDLVGPTAPGAEIGSGAVIAILGALSETDLRQLRQHAPSGVARAVLLDTASWDGAESGPASATDDAATTLRAAGWTVVVASAGSAPDQVWHWLLDTAAAR